MITEPLLNMQAMHVGESRPGTRVRGQTDVLRHGLQMQVSLRIGNLNAMRMKQVPHPQQHLVLYIRTAVHRALDPDAYLKVHFMT